MKKILLVSATQKSKDKFWTDTSTGISVTRHIECNNIDETEIAYNNSKGLCEVYNQFLIEKYRDYIILFVHDDIIIQDINLKLKLNDAIKDYDVVGVAGTAEFGLKSPVVWHNSPKDKWSGAVGHPTGKGQIQITYFGVWPKQCMVLDGLFIAINTEKILDSGVKFDEQFKFHFYDLAFCVDAHLSGHSLGTWDIPLTHFSHGDYNDESWRTSEKKFIEKYS